jgi:hypothetical protein
MSKLYFLIAAILSGNVGNAQIINIPDANLKAMLLESSAESEIAMNASMQFIKIDVNNDNEIDVSEAANVYHLSVPGWEIADLSGIEYFTELRSMNCDANFITNIELLGLLPDLEYLSCIGNALTFVDFSSFAALTGLDCSSNQLSQLDLTGLTNLTSLNCHDNGIITLDLTPVPNLTELECGANQFSTIDLAPVPNLHHLACAASPLLTLDINVVPQLNYLYCVYTQLTSLDVSSLSNLETIICDNSQIATLNLNTSLKSLSCGKNQLQALNLSGLTQLHTLIADSNYISALDLSGLPELHYLNVTDNQLSTLDLSGAPNLTNFYCALNQFSAIDVTVVPNLAFFTCGLNQMTSIDVSSLHGLTYLSCKDMPTLTTLNIKNGSDETTLNISLDPGLEYICADEVQLAAIANQILQYGYTNCQANSYCTFVPGGTSYLVTGDILYDMDNNGCGTTDPSAPYIRLNVVSGTESGSIFSSAAGVYNLPVSAGDHVISPVLEMPSYFSVSAPSELLNFPDTPSPAIRDFCITKNGDHNDLEIVLVPITDAIPGFNPTYKIIYKNKGTATQSGSVTLTYDDAVADLVSSFPLFPAQATNSLTWNFTGLQPFESRIVTVTLNLNSPTESPALNSGDVLNFAVNVSSALIDEFPADNTFGLQQPVVNAFDPNDKTCLEGNVVATDKIGDYVHYVIRFENSGTANAQNIVVKDMIDTAKFDISTLIPLDGSHPFTTRISEGNKVEFIFENINLPFDDANNDGYVAFKIKTKPTFVVGNTFTNTPRFYFDYNFPIITNTATTTIQLLGTPDFEFSQYFTLYPNPAKSVLNIHAKEAAVISSITIYNVLGQLVLAIPNAESLSMVDVSDLKPGNYFVKITSDKGSSSAKFIKE